MVARGMAFVASASLLLSAIPLAAHHSASVQFDMSEKGAVTITGVLVKVEWQNPHIWYYLDVKDADGNVATWGVEGGPPAFLVRRGIRKDHLKIGEGINVQGFRAKDGSNNMNGTVVTFANGRRVFPGFEELVQGAQPR